VGITSPKLRAGGVRGKRATRMRRHSLPIKRLATAWLPPSYRLATTGYTGYHR